MTGARRLPVGTFVGAGLALLLLWFAPASRAQAPPRLETSTSSPRPSPSSAPKQAEVSPDSPRASLRAFFDLTAAGRYAEAARYLTLEDAHRARGPQLAERLAAVLERHLPWDLDVLSPLSGGREEDGLPEGTELLGQIPAPRGGEESVYLVRAHDEAGPYWAFSRRTVSQIDQWYDRLEDRWIRDTLPGPLLRIGPRGLMWWQWLALPVLAVVALAIGRVLGALTRGALHRIVQRTPTQWDERLLARFAPTLTLLWSVAAAAALLPSLDLLAPARAFVSSLLAGGAAIAVFWALWRSVDVSVAFLRERPWAAGNPSAQSLLSVARNLAKAFVAVGGVVTTIAAFGYPVATVLAGLGIGGVAIAFGAQKTVENLFGSVALATDQPFRVGDFVRIEDFVGNVEHIGIRSTRFRTLDRTLISIPNGALASMRIESFAARDRIRFTATIGVVYGTTHEQMKRILAGLERVLREHPKIWPDTAVVRFAGFGASSLDIEVMAWFQTTDYDEFRVCREEALLAFMRVVEGAGSSFAFTTQTVHLVTETQPRSADPSGRPRKRASG